MLTSAGDYLRGSIVTHSVQNKRCTVGANSVFLMIEKVIFEFKFENVYTQKYQINV